MITLEDSAKHYKKYLRINIYLKRCWRFEGNSDFKGKLHKISMHYLLYLGL